MKALEWYAIGSMVALVFALMTWIAAMTWPYWGWHWKWLVKRRDARTLNFFGFLNICLGCFPWQESDAHTFWRAQQDKMSDDMKEHYRAYEPRYSLGWAGCGDSFYRAIGFKLTRRDIRLDVWIGIIWISWMPL